MNNKLHQHIDKLTKPLKQVAQDIPEQVKSFSQKQKTNKENELGVSDFFAPEEGNARNEILLGKDVYGSVACLPLSTGAQIFIEHEGHGKTEGFVVDKLSKHGATIVHSCSPAEPIESVKEILTKRYETMEELATADWEDAKHADVSSHSVFVVVHEYVKDDPRGDDLSHILRLGRAARVHAIVIPAKNHSLEDLPAEDVTNISVRIDYDAKTDKVKVSAAGKVGVFDMNYSD